jgi:hypothetical protein
MDVREGFTPYENQGPFLELIGPILMRHDGDDLVLALEAEDRHANHRGSVQGACSRRSRTSRSAARSSSTRMTGRTARRSASRSTS